MLIFISTAKQTKKTKNLKKSFVIFHYANTKNCSNWTYLKISQQIQTGSYSTNTDWIKGLPAQRKTCRGFWGAGLEKRLKKLQSAEQQNTDL